MEDTTTSSRMTFRQAIAGKWQIPVFLLSMVLFTLLLVHLRPRKVELSYDEKLAQLQILADQDRYTEFYAQAELLRPEAQTPDQAARLYQLAARTRIRQMRQRNELGLNPDINRSSPANYDALINEYSLAFHFGAVDPNAPAAAPVFRDLAHAYWCRNEAEKAILCLHRALELSPDFSPQLHRELVICYLAARTPDYLDHALHHLDQLLNTPDTPADDQAWAFVRRQEVLIAKGMEDQALAELNNADPALRQSGYGDELEFLRGRALHHAGKLDQADLILRDLLDRMTGRGDIYAQAALELGRINYEQFRDYDARLFYEKVTATQAGKDWYAAALFGLAECAALQQRYDISVGYYQQAVDLLLEKPFNRALEPRQVRNSLAVLAHKLSLLKEYALALPFLEIEQQIAPPDDVDAANRFATVHARLAEQLAQRRDQALTAVKDQQPSGNEQTWLQQQQDLISSHYLSAADNYIRVAEIVVGNDDLYGDALWNAATCYDKAGDTLQSIDTWLRFYREREGRVRWPRAVFYLAQAYQSIADLAQAMKYYHEVIAKHPQSPAAFDSMVPLARCYLTLPEPDEEKAEQILLGILDNRALTPDAPYFRQAMFELGQLYYDTRRYPQAINILTEAIDRYPGNRQLGKSMFLVADSYRKSGLALDDIIARLADDPTSAVTQERTSDARRRHLEAARHYFSTAIDFYEAVPSARRNELDDLYLRHAYLYRADCLYDLQQFAEAARLYEVAALRYQLTPVALNSLLQIVNCHIRLDQLQEARSANERARWQLRKMTDTELAVGPFAFSRTQWQNWFDWIGNSSLWQNN